MKKLFSDQMEVVKGSIIDDYRDIADHLLAIFGDTSIFDFVIARQYYSSRYREYRRLEDMHNVASFMLPYAPLVVLDADPQQPDSVALPITLSRTKQSIPSQWLEDIWNGAVYNDITKQFQGAGFGEVNLEPFAISQEAVDVAYLFNPAVRFYWLETAEVVDKTTISELRNVFEKEVRAKNSTFDYSINEILAVGFKVPQDNIIPHKNITYNVLHYLWDMVFPEMSRSMAAANFVLISICGLFGMLIVVALCLLPIKNVPKLQVLGDDPLQGANHKKKKSRIVTRILKLAIRNLATFLGLKIKSKRSTGPKIV